LSARRGVKHLSAANREVAHYAYHVGWILFAAKDFATAKAGKWDSLSVPRKQSAQFTADVAAGRKNQR
jgi:hypothetical protein